MAARDPMGRQPAGGGGWREQVTLASGLNLLAGIWLIIAPFVLNYDSADPVWNDVVFGAAIATVGLVRLGGLYRESWLSWSNAVFGAWIFVSAFWLDNSATAAWNDLILGAIVIVLAVWSASASETPVVTREDPRRSGRRPPPGEAGDRPTW